MLAHLAQEQSFVNQDSFQVIVISFLYSPVSLIWAKWYCRNRQQSRADCTVFTIWRRGKQFYQLGIWTHPPSLLFLCPALLPGLIYTCLPTLSRSSLEIYFPIVYSWVWSWGNGTGWESSYRMNGLYTFRTVKYVKDRKEWEAVPKVKSTDTL